MRRPLATRALLGTAMLLAVVLVAALLVRYHVRRNLSARDAKFFDALVTRELIWSGCQHRVPFDFHVRSEHGKREYVAEFRLGSADPQFFCECTVTVAPSGRLLTPKDIERVRKRVVEYDARVSEPELRCGNMMFPSIGKRALLSLVISPGGGGDSVVFTTSDGRLDVCVSQSNRLKDGIEEPGVDGGRIASELSDQYDKATR